MKTGVEMGTGSEPIARWRCECAVREVPVPISSGSRGKYVGLGLTVLLLTVALASAGCSEQHAPAATGVAGGVAASGADLSPATEPNQDVTVGLEKQDAFSADISPDLKKDPAKGPSNTAAESAKPAAGAAATAAVAAPASRLPSGVAGGTANITFDTIKFEMEKTQPFKPEMLTPAIRALDGKRMRIRGYILPSFQQMGITQFVLVRDNMQCCFGPGAALYDCIVVDMAAGKTTEFKVTPVTVEGTFSMSELLDPDGKHLAIFHLTGESVR